MHDENLEVWSVKENGADPKGKAFWKHVGRAFMNRDGSINVLLDALPLSGKLQIRKRREEQATAA